MLLEFESCEINPCGSYKPSSFFIEILILLEKDDLSVFRYIIQFLHIILIKEKWFEETTTITFFLNTPNVLCIYISFEEIN